MSSSVSEVDARPGQASDVTISDLNSAELDHTARTLFFVVGPPRSGTTLLQAMLNAHSGIAIPPETEFFLHCSPRPAASDSSAGSVSCLARWMRSTAFAEQGIDREHFMRGLREHGAEADPPRAFLMLMTWHARRFGRKRVGEKSPHHLRHLRALSDLFPCARFIVMVRDPRGTVASRLRMPWHRGTHFAAAREWCSLMRGYHDIAADPELASRCALVRMEDLVREPEGHLRRLCDLLDEPFDASMLAYQHRNRAGFDVREQAWKGKTLEPLDPAVCDGWQRELSPRQIAGVERAIGHELMQQFGYIPLTGVYRLSRGTAPAGDGAGPNDRVIRARWWWRLADARDIGGELVSRWLRSLAKRVRRPR